MEKYSAALHSKTQRTEERIEQLRRGWFPPRSRLVKAGSRSTYPEDHEKVAPGQGHTRRQWPALPRDAPCELRTVWTAES